MKTFILIGNFVLLFYNSIFARDNFSQTATTSNPLILLSGCAPSTARVDLDIANVRCPIWINGDMWWDLSGSALYEIPKNSGKKSLFAGAFWIGGKDGAGNLKLAAQTYRQSGSDFWPGPIDTVSLNITPSQCLAFDKFWKITRQEVADFISNGITTPAITTWPGNGPAGAGISLAPFYDHNGDGVYDYTDGDYPGYNIGSFHNDINHRLNGDQTIWWVFNDIGNVHTETNSFPLGIEIRAQAYAFCSPDTDVSNTTFYSYEIINRSLIVINETSIGHWVDSDLGNYLDDYVGCDVSRNLGYAYNGDDNDEGSTGYGTIIPAVGIDILSGPAADLNDSIDNNRNGTIDEPGEDILMTKFIYYNNDNTVIGNPITTLDYYNYLTGIWKDNSTLLYGGTGHQTSGALLCNFMFPGNSDPQHVGTNGIDPGFNWSEKEPCSGCSANAPSDRRFLMSSGKFEMLPGEVKYFTKAAVWARIPGGADSSLSALLRTDDRIQSFFDSDFTNIATCSTIGINEIGGVRYSVFPSPAKDFIKINFENEQKSFSIKIFSADGKLVYQSGKIKGENNIISTENFRTGFYYLTIYDDKNSYKTEKISVIDY
jgi:hypothetical protein